MKIEQRVPSQGELLTPETITILESRFEEAKAALMKRNMEMTQSANRIKDENLMESIKAKLGVIPAKVAGLENELAQFDISLN